MIRLKSSLRICRPLEEVFKQAESYPAFVGFFHKKETKSSSDSFLSVEVGMKRYGLTFEWAGEGVKTKNKSIDFTQTKGLLKGMKARWTFTPIHDHETEVAIEADFEMKIPVAGFILERAFSGLLVEKTTQRILSELKKVSESPPQCPSP